MLTASALLASTSHPADVPSPHSTPPDSEGLSQPSDADFVNLRMLKETGSQSSLAFLRLVASKDEVYVGEAVPLRLELYSMSARDARVEPLSAEGFTLGEPTPLPPRDVRLSNQVYRLDTHALTAVATRPGDLQLGPALCRLTLQLPVRSQSPSGTAGGRSEEQFTTDYRLRSVLISNDPVRIRALPLPPYQVPPGFGGAVGQYSLAVTAKPTNVAVGEPIQVQIEICGTGSLDKATFPTLRDWGNFKVYGPTAQVESEDSSGLGGRKRFRLEVVPKTSEITNLPGVGFSYFDPDGRRYRTVNSKPLALTVRPAAPRAGRDGTETNPAPATLDDLGRLKLEAGRMRRPGRPWVSSPWFWLLQAVPICGYAGTILWRKRRDFYLTHPQARRGVQVDRSTRDGLARLSTLAEAGNPDEFYSLTFHLLQERLGERLNRPTASITEAVVAEALKPAGTPTALQDRLQNVFALCNAERFSRPETSRDLRSDLSEVRDLLDEIRKLRL